MSKIVPVSGVTFNNTVSLTDSAIWDEIKNVRLEMFALPDQFVNKYYKPILLGNENKLCLATLTTIATSALPALETAIKSKYTVEQAERFVVVSLIPTK